MDPVLAKAVGTAASALVRRVLRPPASSARLVDQPIRLGRWISWQGSPSEVEQRKIHRLVRRVLLQAGDADAGVRLIGPDEGGQVTQALTATLLSMGSVTIDLVHDADLDADRLAEQLVAAAPEPELSEEAEDLYERLLTVCCRHIVEFVTSQPGYLERAAVGHAQQLAEIRERLPRLDVEATYFERRLREILPASLDESRLFGLQLPPSEKTYQLSTAYVSLTLQTAGGPDRGAGMRVEDALAYGTRWLIEGPAGCGKTTLLRRLAVHTCRGDLPAQLVGWKGAVPFLLRLRDFVDRPLPAPEEFVAAEASAIAGEKPDRWVSRLLLTGRAVVLIDGVDEVREDERPRVVEWIKALVKAYENPCYLLTSRPASRPAGWREQLQAVGFRPALLQPMTTKQVTDFIRRWHRSAKVRSGDAVALRACETSLTDALSARRDLRQLATTPLLCAMLCALNLANNSYLPRGRVALYEDALAMLLERRDREQRIRSGPYQLTRDQLEPMLSRIAIWMMFNGRRTIGRSVALRQIADPLRRIQSTDIDGKLTPEIVLRHLAERSGVLQEPAADVLEFRHPSFQDYLAAGEVFDQEYFDHLLRNAHDPLYHDVVIMAVGRSQKAADQQTRLLRGLVTRAQSEHRHEQSLWLLAAACIADVGLVDPDTAELIRRQTSKLIPPSDITEADGLAQAGEFVLDLLADTVKRGTLTDRQAAATVHAAAMIGGNGAIPVLAALGRRRAEQVQQALVSAWLRSNDPRRYAEEILADAPLPEAGFITLHDAGFLSYLSPLRGLRALRCAATDLDSAALIAPLTRLERLYLSDTQISDLTPLAGLTRLVRLDLDRTPVSDLRPLAGLTDLQWLFLSGTDVTDIQALASLTKLRWLFLDETQVTDLAPLAKLTNLERLYVGDQATDLRPVASHPKLQIRATSVSVNRRRSAR